MSGILRRGYKPTLVVNQNGAAPTTPVPVPVNKAPTPAVATSSPAPAPVPVCKMPTTGNAGSFAIKVSYNNDHKVPS